ncbi:unnamed protein product [Sphagnum balticum]
MATFLLQQKKKKKKKLRQAAAAAALVASLCASVGGSAATTRNARRRRTLLPPPPCMEFLLGRKLAGAMIADIGYRDCRHSVASAGSVVERASFCLLFGKERKEVGVNCDGETRDLTLTGIGKERRGLTTTLLVW